MVGDDSRAFLTDAVGTPTERLPAQGVTVNTAPATTVTASAGPGPALRRLRAQVRGEVLSPDSPGYAAGRAAWNLNAEHRPDVVVMAACAGDVEAAVRFASRHDLGLGVMATGHGTGTPCVGGVLVNTSRLRAFRLDPHRRRARVQPGVLWSDVVAAAAPHGLAGLPGSSSRVGVVGYTTGGGFGWLGRHLGLAADSVIRADVVTASGRTLRVDERHHEDLFWGLRGGGGNFGVVTSLEFRLHPVGTVYAGNLFYPLQRAREVLEAYAAWCPTLPDAMASSAAFVAFPPADQVPEPLRGRRFLAIRACYSGPHLRHGVALVDALRRAGLPALDTVVARPVSDLDAVSMDPTQPVAASIHPEMLRDLSPAAIDTLVDLGTASPLAMLEIRQLGGALTPRPSRLSPMGRSGATFSLNAIGLTATPEQRSSVRTYLEHLAARLRPHVTGATYHNFLDLEGATPDRVRAAYSAEDWERLVTLKRRYDPDHTFRFTRTISPEGPHR